MSKLFEVRDSKNREIYLSEERWRHIVSEHPELSGKIENIKETIVQPSFIRQSKYDKKLTFIIGIINKKICIY